MESIELLHHMSFLSEMNGVVHKENQVVANYLFY